MLHLFTGTDRMMARSALNDALAAAVSKNHGEAARITDTHMADDLLVVLRGGGLFGGARVVVLDEVSGNDVLWETVLAHAEDMSGGPDTFFIFEESMDAPTRKRLEKYAQKSEKFDAPKKEKKGGFNFRLADTIRAGNKKAAWLEYQRELLGGSAAEAIHGLFFWAAKQTLMQARSEADTRYGRALVAKLAELPHEARRQGAELEYPLERLVLSIDVLK